VCPCSWHPNKRLPRSRALLQVNVRANGLGATEHNRKVRFYEVPLLRKGHSLIGLLLKRQRTLLEGPVGILVHTRERVGAVLKIRGI
jgi:hypothetical protein